MFLGLLTRRHDIERGELAFHVDPEPRPRLLLEPGRDLRRPGRKISNVTDARLHVVPAAEVARNRLGFGRRLDDHKTSTAAIRPAVFRHARLLQWCYLISHPGARVCPHDVHRCQPTREPFGSRERTLASDRPVSARPYR